MDLQSILGYSKGSPFANNPYLDINTPEGLIDMSNTDIDLWGIDNKGNRKKMKAGRKKPYQFPGDQVREIPVAQQGKLVNPFGDPRDLVTRNSSESTQAPVIPKQEELAQQQLKRIQDQAVYLNQAKVPTAAQRATSVAKNKAYAAANPYAKVNEQGDLVPKQYDRSIAGTPDYGSQAGRNDKALDHAMGAIDAASLVMPAGQLIGKGLKAAGKYLTEQTALKNAYKLNPFAFKPNPESYYRMIGKEGYTDALESGIIRANPNNIHPWDGTQIYNEPYFSKGVPLDRNWKSPLSKKIGSIYKGPNMVEVNDASKFKASDSFVSSPNSELSSFDPSVKLYKEDWLRGYKELPKNKPGEVYWNGKGYQNSSLSSQEILPKSSITKAPSIDISKNLEDLKYAQEWANPYGYRIPENLDRIASSNMLTDRTIRGLANRHNTFVRGVSTNWDELEKRNPEILRHLEGKGFDLTTEEGSKKAAEYMSTHIPIRTGYGRASLDKNSLNIGEDGLYTSNSIPTAEGYTYGNGYVVKAKRPTDFTSPNRKDWIDKNKLKYIDEDEFRGSRYFERQETEDMINDVFRKNNPISRTHEEKIAEVKKRLSRTLVNSPDDPATMHDLQQIDKYASLIGKSKHEYGLLRTERSTQAADPFKFLLDKGSKLKNDTDISGLRSFLKDHPYRKKLEEMNELGDTLSKYTWEQQKPIRARIDILKDETNREYNEAIKEYMKKYPDFDPGPSKYAHYIHIGTQGEKVLEPLISKRITPEIWKNKSRAHTNTYSRGLSAGAVAGVVAGNQYQKGGPTKEDIYKFLFDDEPTAPDTTEVPPQPEQQEDETDLPIIIANQDGFFRNNPYINNPRLDRFPTSPKEEDKGMWAYNYLVQQKGLAPHVAAGIVGNFDQESGRFRDDVIAGTKKGDNGLATGIAQWHPDRWKKAEQWANSTGNNIRTLKGQLDWAIYEASQRGDLQKVSKARDTEEAAYLFAKHYERPKIIDKNRARFAKRYNPYKQGGIYQEIFKTNE